MPTASTARAVGSPAPARPGTAARLADYVLMAVSVVLGGGSLVLFAWGGGPLRVRLELPPATALGWNVLLSLFFFLQHSLLVRRPVRARLSAFLPERYHGAFYSITSGLALTPFAVLAQPVGGPLFVLQGALRQALVLASVAALAVFVWGVYSLRTFDPFGLRPIRRHLRGAPPASAHAPAGKTTLVVRGPYRFVRHPLYSAVIVMLWADPELSLGRLAIAASWTGWICVGAVLEERDLAAEFGNTYRQYCRSVPMLVPWRGRLPG